jgi:hypothetical protein
MDGMKLARSFVLVIIAGGVIGAACGRLESGAPGWIAALTAVAAAVFAVLRRRRFTESLPNS